MSRPVSEPISATGLTSDFLLELEELELEELELDLLSSLPQAATPKARTPVERRAMEVFFLIIMYRGIRITPAIGCLGA